ncbi:MAG TPA: DUF1499 domain-containing protein [Candidatus Binataceae bacterium]|nr:DUF1499 domain-containing protein [Candidatus Binataceae bacterium]
MTLWLILGIVVAVVALLIFVRVLRVIIGLALRLVIVVGAIVAAVGGVAMLMNNETIFEQPGTWARIARFLTVNAAATSDKGLGTAVCYSERAGSGGQSVPRKSAEKTLTIPQASPSATPTPPPGVASIEENVYPELVTRGYPGISRDKLFQMAQDSVNEMGGWKIIKSDARAGTLDCIYVSRILGFEDAIKIFVSPRSDIELCSHSKIGEPDASSLIGSLFHGDFGANIGHIKQFYTEMQPKVDALYKAREREQTR